MSTLKCWICRHPNVSQSKDNKLIDSILGDNKTLECPICYENFDFDNLFFTECKHYACCKCTDSMFKKNAPKSCEISEEILARAHEYHERITSDGSRYRHIIYYNHIINIDNNNIIINIESM